MTIEGPGGERLRIEVEVNDDEAPADRPLAMLVEGLHETEVVAGPNLFTGQAWPTYTVEGPRAELLTVVVRNVMLTQDVHGAPVLDPGLLADHGELEEAVRLHLGYGVTS